MLNIKKNKSCLVTINKSSNLEAISLDLAQMKIVFEKMMISCGTYPIFLCRFFPMHRAGLTFKQNKHVFRASAEGAPHKVFMVELLTGVLVFKYHPRTKC